MARQPAPKNIIADRSGVVTPEWLFWLQQIADAAFGVGLDPNSPPLTPPPALPDGGGPGTGGGGITIINNYGSGTPGRITKWIAPQQLTDSIISESNGVVTVDGPVIATSFQGILPLHHITHEAGGTDAIQLDNLATPDDNTDLNASTVRHGLLPKLSGNSAEVLNGQGLWIVVSGGGGGGTDEVWIGPGTPPAGLELWYDTDALAEPDGPPGILKVFTGGVWVPVRVANAPAHAPTHQPGGSDPMQVDAAAATGSLRTLGSGPNQATAGNDPRLSNARTPTAHAPTHSAGGSDAVDVKALAGYPGGTTTFLRADHTFAAPPGGGAGMNLDYLGNYVAGPVYNDGDIVIAADNIAYMCVVDGTTTPPEPWPGVGMATAVGPPGPPGPAGVDAAVDATYWTVTPHAGLVNERALSLLANGYVKSLSGVPFTVAIIPVSEGGTNATNAVDARANIGCGTIATINLNGNPATYLRGDGAFVAVSGIPSGMIAIFQTACPVGWTRVAAFDAKFLRGSAAYGAVGGSQSHQHSAEAMTAAGHAHGAGTLAGPSHNHGGLVGISGNTGSAGGHTHGYSGAVNGVSSVNDSGEMNVDAGGSGNMARGPHKHNVNISFSGTTDAIGDHVHTVSLTGTIPADGTGAVTGLTGTSGAVAVTGFTDLRDHTPPYIDVVYCKKD